MERNLSDRIMSMKIRLALATQKLSEYGQQNFANYIYVHIGQLHNSLDDLKYAETPAKTEEHLNAILQCMREIENVLLACKMGVSLPLEDSTLAVIKEVKSELKEIIRRQEFTGKAIG